MDHTRIITNASQWFVTSIKIKVHTKCKIKNQQSCVLLTSGVFLLRGACPRTWSVALENFILEMSLEQSMVNKLKNAQCCLFLQTKILYQFRDVHQTSSVAFNYGLQTPLSVTILGSKENRYWLSICTSSCAKLS